MNVFSLSLPDDLRREIDHYAARETTSVAQFIRKAIQERLERERAAEQSKPARKRQ